MLQTYTKLGPGGYPVANLFGSNVYSDSVSEIATAADAVSAGLDAVGAVVESSTATDDVSSVAVLAASVAEAGSAADVDSGALTAAATVTESGSAADAVAALLIVPATVAESAPATDAVVGAGVFSASLAEAASATDIFVADGAAYGSVDEVASASDSTDAMVRRASIRVIDPRYMTVEAWTTLTATALLPFGGNVPHYSDEANWRDWALRVRGITALASLGIPDPRGYQDWREWAFGFNSAIWVGGNGVP